ncbi:MAG: LpxI family protein [Desulfonatronovibrionaceae bacterium]
MSEGTIGLIAGGGRLPLLIAEKARQSGRRVAAVGFASNTDPELARNCSEFVWLKLGQLSGLIRFLQQNNVQEAVLAGSIDKPRALDIRPDFRAAKLLWGMDKKGDDSLLRAVAGELEKEGIKIGSCLEIVPELRVPEGQLTSRAPARPEKKDIQYGREVLGSIGSLDIGQSIVVYEQMIVAVEAVEGTNAAILRAGELLHKRGGTIIKGAKPGQDLRFDQPALGPQTIETMHTAGLSCLAFCARTCIFFQPEKSKQLADSYGMSILGLPGI